MRRLDFPWEGIVADLLLIQLWSWSLPRAVAWCQSSPHLAVWSVATLQAIAVGRMVALYLGTRGGPKVLGPLEPLGGLAAVLSVGGFMWLFAAMFSSNVQWGFVTLRMPLLMVFASLGSLAMNIGAVQSGAGVRPLPTRIADSVLVVAYLFLAEAFLFAMIGTAGQVSRGPLILALVLCHVPIRMIFALVPPTSRYELLSASLAFILLLRSL